MPDESDIPFEKGDWLIDRGNPGQPRQFTGESRNDEIELTYLDGSASWRSWHDFDLLFRKGDWLIDRHNPGQPGMCTGRVRKSGSIIMVELRFPDGSTLSRPLHVLEKMPLGQESLLERIINGHFGRASDLRRVITYEKLKGTLHEVIYSMEAAQIDFYPYQFKPVMKLINAPTERLILADEVGLGKTIEAALIWLELQARRQAKRLLVVCPNTLSEKWRDELRYKFLIDARIVNFTDLREEISNLRQSGSGHTFALIGTYTGLRPPKSELRLLDLPTDVGETGTAKTEFLRELRHGEWEHDPFDLVIFDEAHNMRNPATTTFHLGESLSACAGAVICISATPVNNSNIDLHSLLRLIDESFFESQGMFEELLEANRPAVLAGNALARVPMDRDLVEKAIAEMASNRYIQNSPMFQRFKECIASLDPDNNADMARCQSMAESLNLLGQYVNRTRRVQVKEQRPVRDPHVLEVEFVNQEMTLYRTILKLVRERCKRDSRPFHVFQVLGLQLRAASCLPALAEEIKSGRFGDVEDLMGEAMGGETYEDLFDDGFQDEMNIENLRQLLQFDFEANDSKYQEFRRMLKLVNDEKVVVFAYYRATLSYLFRRLQSDGVSVTVIHGGVSYEDRWKELKRFRDPLGPQVLLSSEVGSEGIDLEFSRIVVNYDLPWNIMRVEQRIGRIDRVGQTADRLLIVNFKVRDTVEERLYEILHKKFLLSQNSLGDMEAIIGREVQALTVDLLSKDLTPEQERERIEKTKTALENQIITLQQLEESGDALVALSDYLQRRIDEVRDRGRYMQHDEMEDYVVDFFRESAFRGCTVHQNTPSEGCMRISLSQEAYSSLAAFIQNDRSLSARPFRQREFDVSFRREAIQRLTAKQSKDVYFVNHLSPLVRWITKNNRDRSHALFNVSAMTLSDAGLPTGTYCYCIERWRIKALGSREQLAYAVVSLDNESSIDADVCEETVQLLLRHGEDWDRASCDEVLARRAFSKLANELGAKFDLAVGDFEAENATVCQIREQRIRGFFERRIRQDEQRLQTLLLHNPDSRVVRATEGRLRVARENMEQKLRELGLNATLDVEQAPVAAGIFRAV